MDTRTLSFGRWLRSEIEESGHDPAWLARTIGVSSGTVSNWLMDKRRPEAESCEAIAHALDIEPEIVLQRAGRLKRPTISPQTSEINQALRRLDRVQGELEAELARIRRAGFPSVEVRYRGRLPADSVRWVETREEFEAMSVPERMLGGRSPRRVFAATVTGDCLAAIYIPDGALVFCEELEPGQEPKNGQVVAVELHDEVTLKVWQRDGDWIELRDGEGKPVARFSIMAEYRVEGVVFGSYTKPGMPGGAG